MNKNIFFIFICALLFVGCVSDDNLIYEEYVDDYAISSKNAMDYNEPINLYPEYNSSESEKITITGTLNYLHDNYDNSGNEDNKSFVIYENPESRSVVSYYIDKYASDMVVYPFLEKLIGQNVKVEGFIIEERSPWNKKFVLENIIMSGF